MNDSSEDEDVRLPATTNVQQTTNSRQQQQQQQQLAFDNNSTTNCSETMSDDDAQLRPTVVAGLDSHWPATGSQVLSGENQITGDQQQQQQQQQQQSREGGQAAAVSNRWSPLETESDQNTTLSLNSFGLSSDQQLPPSYRAACTSTQLLQLAPIQFEHLEQQPKMTNSRSIASLRAAAHLESRGCANADSSAAAPTTTGAIVKSGPAENQQRWISVDLNSTMPPPPPPQQQQQQLQQLQPQLGLHQRMPQHGGSNHLSMQADNNRNNSFNGRPQMAAAQPTTEQQQQQQHQLCSLLVGCGNGNLPINHVISAEGSMRHHWQANQYYATSAGYGIGGGGSNDYVTHQQLQPQPFSQQQQQLQLQLQLQLQNQIQNQSAPGAQQLGNFCTAAAAASSSRLEPASISNQSSWDQERQSRSKTTTTLERHHATSTKQRKRRRHRSATATSGRHTMSASASSCGASAAAATTMELHHRNENENEQQRENQNHLPQSISAHCWLIDSSDDQVSTSRYRHHQQQQQPQKISRSLAGFGPLTGSGSTPLTVAMMRQQQQHRSETLDTRRLQMAAVAAATATANGDQRQTMAMATNSLRMHRTSSGHASNSVAIPAAAPNATATASASATIRQVSSGGAKFCNRSRHDRNSSSPSLSPSSSSSSSSSSSASSSAASSSGCRVENSNANASNNSNAGVILRLSAILSMASRLVRKQPSSRATSSTSSSSQRRRQQRSEPSHISGSSSAPYTAAGSLAISSSSSTSAYATGSQSSSSQQQQQQQRLLQLNVINQQHQSMSTFYGPTSSLPSGGLSSHAYEYCDSIDIGGLPPLPPPICETKFTCELKPPTTKKEISSDCSSGSSSPIDSAATTTQNDHQLRPLPTQSDHELISAGSLERHDPDPAGFRLLARSVLAAESAAAASRVHTSARRRWWWLNLKNYLRRPCTGSQENLNLPSSAAAAAAQGMIPSQQQTAQATVASYKSLRSAKHGNRSSRSRTGTNCLDRGAKRSTMANVISLAKADRAFRLRLLASVLVSCILLALICLLAAVVYTRSGSSFLLQNRRLNLLVDDSDYDLSWLWPQSAQQQKQHQQPQTDLPAYRQLIELENQNQRQTISTLAMDGNLLRRHLIMIEQSERLEQFQQTLAHLTSIQLANDNFIDLVQLIDSLMQSQASQNLSSVTNSSSWSSSRDTEDLVYVTLLTNLHWPLVKWRHQNQQSVASFLSAFAPSTAYPSNQNLRNLLSLLMLAESRPATTAAAAAAAVSHSDSRDSSAEALLMKQIVRLNSLLRNISIQLINCAPHLLDNHLRERFCRKLIGKYQRMMQILSQLNHSHLAKLQAPYSIEFKRATPLAAGTGGNQINQRANTRTLIGFFLDRLALLDVQLVAEEVVATADSDFLEKLTAAAAVSESSRQSESDATKKLIDSLILANIAHNSRRGNAAASESPDQSSTSNSAPSQLYELAKTFVGDSPVNLNINLARNREFHSKKLQQLELDDQRLWHRVVSQGILLPWSARELPQFVANLVDYDLFVHANLSTKFVQGMVKIEFKVKRATRFLVLNSVDLNLADITLWLKQDPGKQQQQQQNASLADAHNETNLREIPIRRVLSNANQEQIYVELQDQLESHTTWTNIFDPNGSVNFGDLSISISGRTQSQASMRLENVYVLSVAFNKTSLMRTNNNNNKPTATTTTAANDGQSINLLESVLASSGAFKSAADSSAIGGGGSGGLKFVHYGDYFAQTEAEVKTMLYTRFEPTNARQIFPSFDEPKFKARFQLNLVHQNNHQALANGQKRERIPYTSDGSLQMSVFEPTVQIPMSTYMVSFMIFDSSNIKSVASRIPQLSFVGGSKQQASWPSSDSSSGSNQQQQQQQQKHIQIQIMAQFEHLGQTEFAASLVPQLLSFYQTYLQFPYPLEKLDLVALPDSSSSYDEDPLEIGASRHTLANLGLVPFRSGQLLVDANLINQDLIEQTAKGLAHKLAHQYFGNIIAIPDWSTGGEDLWLYEALCKYLESLALSRAQTDWRLEEQFPVLTIQETLDAEQYYPPAPSVVLSSAKQQQQPSAISQQSGQAADGNVQLQPLDLLQLGKDETIQESAAATTLLLANLDNLQQQPPSLHRQEEIESPPADLLLDSVQDTDILAAIGGQEELLLSTSESFPWGRRHGHRHRQSTMRELKRNSAILHMLLFNLLPTQEAQGRLLRSCLSQFHSRTMSLGQFWRQFGLQLQQDSSFDRLALDVTRLLSAARSSSSSSSSLNRTLQSTDATTDQQQQQQQQQQTNERIVFVRGKQQPSRRHQQHQLEDLPLAMMQEPQSDRLSDNLDLIADMWIERSGYPLISVTAYRDHIHLKQERFSSNWWMQNAHLHDSELVADFETTDDSFVQHDNSSSSLSTNTNEEDWWPIPLMFVSRYNPKLARFFWMANKEIDIPFGEHISSDSSFRSLVASSASGELAADKRLAPRPGWFKLNLNQSSLVRVNYDERLWDSLSDLLIKSHYSNHILNPLDRANLIDDALTLMRCGKLSVGVAMNLTLYLEVGERDYVPWTMALKHLDQMQTLLNQNPLWHRYVLKLLQPISSIIGWKDDGPHLMRKLRRQLFGVALQYGDEKSISKAKQEFKAWSKNGRFIVPNLQELVYVAGVRYGDQQEWFHCWQRYQQLASSSSALISSATHQASADEMDSNQRTSNWMASRLANSNHHHTDTKQQQPTIVGMPPFINAASSTSGSADSMGTEANIESEKHQLLTALASTQNTWLIEQFLNYSLDASKIERTHLKHIIHVLGKNPVARLYLWRFVRLNWFNLFETHQLATSGQDTDSSGANLPPETSSSNNQYEVLETMVIESTRHFATKLDYDEVKTFFDSKRKQHKQSGGGAGAGSRWSASLDVAMQQSLQIIQSNIHWRNVVEPKLTNWLSHFGGR